MSMATVNLRIDAKDEPPLFLELGVGSFLFGRSEECEILIDRDGISRKHARLTVRETGVFLEDLGSINGTYIDGSPAQSETQIVPGQTVVLGNDVLKVQLNNPQQESQYEANFQSHGGAATPDLMQSNYVFKTEIARGGMGTVLEAQDLNTGRTVAIKKMLQGRGATAEGQFRFQQEARVMGFLEHPNIVPMHELGVNEKGVPYYTMKHVRGETLQRVLSAIKAGDVDMIREYRLGRLLEVFQKICDAMAFAHSKGVVHRDLKPENILIGEFGEVMVMDWGLAKLMQDSPLRLGFLGFVPDVLHVDVPVDSPVDDEAVSESGRFHTRDGSVIGTPNYMPPEQAEGRLAEIDHRADIFSLGGILYSILTLRPPVTGSTVDEVLENMRTGYIAPPIIYNKVKFARFPGVGGGDNRVILLRHCPGKRVPDVLSKVAMTAMAFDAAERYTDVRALQEDIAAWQSGHATRAENAGWQRRTALFVARHKATAFALLAVFLSGLVFLTRAYVEEQHTQAELNRLREGIPFIQADVRSQITAGRFGSALNRVETLLVFLPEDADYHVQKGDLLQSLLRFLEAAKAYRKAISVGADRDVMRESIDISEKLEVMTDSSGEPTEEGIRLLLEHLNSRRRFAEAKRLADRHDSVEMPSASPEALEAYRQSLREQDAPEEVLLRVNIDQENRLMLDLHSLDIDEIDWLAGVPFEKLNLANTGVSDLRPLRGMPLRELILSNAPVEDLAPLAEALLEYIDISRTRVDSISVLKGMPLRTVSLRNTAVSDLTPLSGAPLETLAIDNSKVRDLSPLAGAKIRHLFLSRCEEIQSLEPIRDMPLESIGIGGTLAGDLTMLRGKPLRILKLADHPVVDFEFLRGIRTLKHGTFSRTKLSDLSVLENCVFNELWLDGISATNFAPLGGTIVDWLNLSQSQIRDLEVLSTAELRFLDLSFTRISDLRPLTRNTRIHTLFLHGCNGITDWAPLLKVKGLRQVTVSAGDPNLPMLQERLPRAVVVPIDTSSSSENRLLWRFWKNLAAARRDKKI
jgi:serine/threonine protein kinase/Leucine-rich repeat (LRR) protein